MKAGITVKSTALMILFCILLGLFCACVTQDGGGGTGDGSTQGGELTSGGDEITDAPDIPRPEDGTLLYYEDFESYQTDLSDNGAVMEALGWKIENSEDGAYKNSTVRYSITDKNSSRMLCIDNNYAGGDDSYAVILSGAQFGAYHLSDYTYQYDVIYGSGNNTENYIALVSGYSGDFYNCFALRNRGNGSHEVHTDGQRYSYDFDGASATTNNAIVTKLLGKRYDGSVAAFTDISVSIRYCVSWDSGNTVYMRVNTEGYPGSSQWTFVGTFKDTSAAAPYHDPYAGGGALAIKTKGKQNGYIDNIVVWSGCVEEPANISETPVLNSKSEGCSYHVYFGSGICEDVCACFWCGDISEKNIGHSFVDVNYGTGDERCTACGYIKSNAESGDWPFPTVPVYDGGSRCYKLYLCGQGLDDPKFDEDNESVMQIIYSTSESQFERFISKLDAYGLDKRSYRELDGNIFAEYTTGDDFIYTYYTASARETRIILDKKSDTITDEFGYTREKLPTETTILYQYGLPMNEEGVNYNNNNEKKIDCGMMYVMKLADNSVIIIDGGGYQQFDTAQIDGFMTFLREVTGKTKNEKITIAGWYITHAHIDHFAGISLFFKKYSENFILERIFCNFPSVYSDDSTLAGHKNNTSKLIGYIDTYLGNDYEFLQIHTGQRFNIGEVTIDVLFTHEDIVKATNGMTEISGDFNNSCSVIKIEFDGKSFMVLGDVNRPSMKILLDNYSDATLKSDVVQMSHHVINNLEELYHKIRASVVFAPQSPNGCYNGTARKKAMAAVQPYIESNMLYYASLGTNGVKVIAGNLSMVYYRGVDGGPHAGWSW